MPTLFESDMYIVKQGWLSGWRVIFKPSGTTILPTLDLKIRIGLIWKKIRTGKYKKMSPPSNDAESILFETFAVCCLDPKSAATIEFLGMDLDDLATSIVYQANIDYTARSLSKVNKL